MLPRLSSFEPRYINSILQVIILKIKWFYYIPTYLGFNEFI